MKAAMTSSLIESNIAYVCDRSYGVTWKEGAMMTWGALRVRARARTHARARRVGLSTAAAPSLLLLQFAVAPLRAMTLAVD